MDIGCLQGEMLNEKKLSSTSQHDEKSAAEHVTTVIDTHQSAKGTATVT
jgi:hypothetical protein